MKNKVRALLQCSHKVFIFTTIYVSINKGLVNMKCCGFETLSLWWKWTPFSGAFKQRADSVLDLFICVRLSCTWLQKAVCWSAGFISVCLSADLSLGTGAEDHWGPVGGFTGTLTAEPPQSRTDVDILWLYCWTLDLKVIRWTDRQDRSSHGLILKYVQWSGSRLLHCLNVEWIIMLLLILVFLSHCI